MVLLLCQLLWVRIVRLTTLQALINFHLVVTRGEYSIIFRVYDAVPPCEQARSNMVVAVSGQIRVVVGKQYGCLIMHLIGLYKMLCYCVYKVLYCCSGSYVPQCDEDGFFTSVQCHSGVGQCWCVDRSGTEIVGSRMTGVPSCDTGELSRDTWTDRCVFESTFNTCIVLLHSWFERERCVILA